MIVVKRERLDVWVVWIFDLYLMRRNDDNYNNNNHNIEITEIVLLSFFVK